MGCCGPDQPKNKVTPVKPFGAPDDDDFNGPLKKRSCTDIICLLIFIVFLGGMGYVAFASWALGDPYRLLYGLDSWGNTCNRPNSKIIGANLSGRDMTGRSKLFNFNFESDEKKDSNVLCIETCPREKIVNVTDLQDFANNNHTKLCRYDINVTDYKNGSSATDKCPVLPVPKHEDLWDRCTPINTLLGNTPNISQAQDKRTFLEKMASDLQKTWVEMLILFAIAFGIALILTFLMRFFACVVIWTLVLGTALGSVAGTVYCWVTWHLEKPSTFWLVIAIICSIVTAIILLILLVLRKRISLVVQLFREAGKAVVKVPFLLIQPIWTLAVLVAVLAGVIFVFLYVETAGHPKVKNKYEHVEFVPDNVLIYMKWYYLFGILWLIQFIMACQQMVIAGSVASWYFARDKSKIGWPILAAIKRLIRYHLGSVAFGSLIIAIIQLARLILGQIESKLKGRAGPVVDFLLKCCTCCLWCFEKLLKFINWNAYIMIAIYGYNFCRGAQRAFSIIVSNVVRVGAINSVGAFCLLLGKLGVVAATVPLGLLLWKDNKDISFSWLPILIVSIFAFFIAHTFLGIYGMMIDTIFMCFCEDCDKNDGVAKPYYMSYGLMEFVDNSKEAIRLAKAREEKAEAERRLPKSVKRTTIYPPVRNKSVGLD